MIYDSEGNLNGSGERTKGNLFYLDETIETCLMVKSDDVWLWHKRLCHVNFDNLVNIRKMMTTRSIMINVRNLAILLKKKVIVSLACLMKLI